jgi:hypothetical protein
MKMKSLNRCYDFKASFQPKNVEKFGDFVFAILAEKVS